jgi:hypothetical protein
MRLARVMRRRRAFRVHQPKITEDSVVMEIVSYFAFQGIRLHRIVERIPTRDGFGRVKGRTSTPGMPDLVGYIRAGKFDRVKPEPVYIEAKKPGGERRPRQEFFIRDLKEDGVIAFFAKSLDEAVDEMRRAGVPMEKLWKAEPASKSNGQK